MIATIVIVSLALIWLGHETRWLTINLRVAVGELDYDLETVDDDPAYYLSEDFNEQCENIELDAIYETQLQEFYQDTIGQYPHGKRRARPGSDSERYHNAQRKALLANFPTRQIDAIERNRQYGV